MSGKEIFADTNIILYLLKGNDTLANLLQRKDLYVSFITELELIGYRTITAAEEQQIGSLLAESFIIPLNEQIKREYVMLRKTYQLKLADAIIAATAIVMDIPFITADKQFSNINELNLIHYAA
jgi:predicted nucleic acid-binding protein